MISTLLAVRGVSALTSIFGISGLVASTVVASMFVASVLGGSNAGDSIAGDSVLGGSSLVGVSFGGASWLEVITAVSVVLASRIDAITVSISGSAEVGTVDPLPTEPGSPLVCSACCSLTGKFSRFD